MLSRLLLATTPSPPPSPPPLRTLVGGGGGPPLSPSRLSTAAAAAAERESIGDDGDGGPLGNLADDNARGSALGNDGVCGGDDDDADDANDELTPPPPPPPLPLGVFPTLLLCFFFGMRFKPAMLRTLETGGVGAASIFSFFI